MCELCVIVRRRTFGLHGTNLHSTMFGLTHGTCLVLCSAAHTVTRHPLYKVYPSCSSDSQSPHLSHSHTVFCLSSLCEAPMVTCGPRKQDKLSTHNSQQCACPLSLAHHARQQKTPPEAPTTSPFKCQPPRLKSQTAM